MTTQFTLIVPDPPDEGMVTLIAKRGDYAHLDRFPYSVQNIVNALHQASSELDLMERLPALAEGASTPSRPKPTRPKKKKVSLNDLPEDPLDTPPTEGLVLQVGQVLALPSAIRDVDGDSLPFHTGRILELE